MHTDNSLKLQTQYNTAYYLVFKNKGITLFKTIVQSRHVI